MLTRPDRFYTAYIFDLDGTVYLGDALLPAPRRLDRTLSSTTSVTFFQKDEVYSGHSIL